MSSTRAAIIEMLDTLQERIGQGNADRGFHDPTLRVMGEHAFAVRRADEAENSEPDDPQYGDLEDAEQSRALTRRTNKELVDIAAHAVRTEFITKLALIVTEAAEAIEDVRNGLSLTHNHYTINGERVTKRGVDGPRWMWVTGDGEAAYSSDHPAKPEGFPSELADIVIRAFDTAHLAGFSLADVIVEKLDFNDTRQRLHGKTL